MKKRNVLFVMDKQYRRKGQFFARYLIKSLNHPFGNKNNYTPGKDLALILFKGIYEEA